MDSNLLRIRHERSKKDFPKLNLEDDEFVEMAFGRAKNSLLFAWAKVGGLAVIVLLVLLLLMVSEIVADENGIGFFLILTLALALVLIGTVMAVTAVHYGNKLFFTNKRVIQIVVNMPFLENERIVNLGAVQEVTYAQTSPVEKMLGFGTLKLSTHEKNIMILDNQTPQSALNIFNDNSGNVYTFKDVAMTQQQINEVNELISKAPKLDHKIVEEESGANVDLADDLEGKDDVAAFNEREQEEAKEVSKDYDDGDLPDYDYEL